MLEKNSLYFNIQYILLLLAMLSLPVTSFLMLPIGMVIFIVWLLEGQWKKKRQMLKQPYHLLFFIVFIAFYLLHLIGLIYTPDLKGGLSEIEGKTWLLVAPLLFFTVDPSLMTRKRINYLFYFFLVSLSFVILVNLGISTVDFFSTHSITSFFYAGLSHHMHPSYQSLYTCVAFAVTFYLLFISPVYTGKIARRLLWGGLILFTLYIFLLQSKAGLLAFISIFLLLGLWLINLKKKRWMISIAFLGAFIAVAGLVVLIMPSSVNRIGTALHSLDESTDDNPKGGTQQRLKVWELSWELALDHLPFGVGPGAVQETLNQAYQEKGYTYIYQKSLNSHNQYLQTFLSLGILGILSLLAYMLLPFGLAVKRKDVLYIAFFVIILLNLMVESMLERRAGCDFIALFSALLCYRMINSPFSSDKKERETGETAILPEE